MASSARAAAGALAAAGRLLRGGKLRPGTLGRSGGAGAGAGQPGCRPGARRGRSCSAAAAAEPAAENEVGATGAGSALAKYAANLTAAARVGKLDPVIGRGAVLRQGLQVLLRRSKNNPVFVGEPGVGKTAIAEGLAQIIALGHVPAALLKTSVWSLDMGSLLAGTRYRGSFEERLNSVLDSAEKDFGGDTILFVDEIHMLVGAGGGQGSMDAANLLKPALARGELRFLGATTLHEYQMHIEKDPALARRFQPIFVPEPSAEATERMLRSLRGAYQEHHGVSFTDGALSTAVHAAKRYFTQRKLPDSAIDLVDEAAASSVLKEVTGRRGQAGLRGADGERTEEEKKELLRWFGAVGEGDAVKGVENRRDLIRARRRTYKQTWGKEKYHAADQDDGAGGAPAAAPAPGKVQVVDAEDILDLVAQRTGIPQGRLEKSEREKLMALEEELGKSVIGQEPALQAIANALRLSRLALQSGARPISSFLFMGPPGVGKSLTSKVLADVMFADRSSLLQFDMSEYSEAHSVSRLLGAPPGYVGHEEGGMLTDIVRQRPYIVCVFDEIEKAHREVQHLLLQVLEEGKLTDSLGRVSDFTNAIIIMTSNMESVAEASLSPELLSRLDEVIFYRHLTRDDVRSIAETMCSEASRTVLERHGIRLAVDAAAVDWLGEQALDEASGARTLRGLVRREIVAPLAKQIILGEVVPSVRHKERAGQSMVVARVSPDGASLRLESETSAARPAAAAASPAEDEAGASGGAPAADPLEVLYDNVSCRPTESLEGQQGSGAGKYEYEWGGFHEKQRLAVLEKMAKRASGPKLVLGKEGESTASQTTWGVGHGSGL